MQVYQNFTATIRVAYLKKTHLSYKIIQKACPPIPRPSILAPDPSPSLPSRISANFTLRTDESRGLSNGGRRREHVIFGELIG